MNDVWLSRPGTASILTPSEGTAHEWRTSSAEIKTRTGEPVGTTTWWSTSKRRNWPAAKSWAGAIYESKPIFS